MSDTLLYVLVAIAALVVALVVVRAMRPGGDAGSEGGASAPAGPSPADAEAATPEAGADAPAASPAPAPAAPLPPDGGEADELTRIKGLGPRAARGLAAIGVTRFDQVARWTAADVETAGGALGEGYAERIGRDRWIEQADLLARGEIAAFEEKFGKLG